MKRRKYIATVAVALAAPVAGCLDESSDDSTGNGDRNGTGAGTIQEDPRTDEPPYEIQRPDDEGVPNGEEYNELYLCEQMPAEPTAQFEQLDVNLDDHSLDLDGPDPSYLVRLLATVEQLESVVAVEDSRDRDRLESIDFDSQVVVLVESGFGSGSVNHHWKRVENDDGVVHLYGCYTQPIPRTDDYTWRHSALVVDRPDEVEFARASLTVSEDERVHFNSTEGIVSTDT